MATTVSMPKTIWEGMVRIVQARLKKGRLDKPIVFALYTPEDNHHEVICYKEITSVTVKGDYPKGEYGYRYPGIKKEGFYPPRGTGKWFSGTLVAGDKTELDEDDKEWMVRDKMDFRIKMDMDSRGQLTWNVYYIDYPIVSLRFQ